MENPRLNATAFGLVERMVGRAAVLGIHAFDDGVNVPVVDCGIDVPGSLQAGLEVAAICMSGLGDVSLVPGDRSIWPGAAVQVRTDHPRLACMASQYAGWQITGEDYFAMGSGPMRALAGKESLIEEMGCRESAAMAVGILESRQFPSPGVCRRLASECSVEHRKLILLVAPTASLVGSIQVVARSVETALHKAHALGFDLASVRSAWGVAPLPPVAGDDVQGIGRTNDSVLYGGQVTLWVHADDDELDALVPKMPSCASADHGQPFARIFDRYDRDFYKIDPHLFSPARVHVNNLKTGRSFVAGDVLPEVLHQSFGQE